MLLVLGRTNVDDAPLEGPAQHFENGEGDLQLDALLEQGRVVAHSDVIQHDLGGHRRFKYYLGGNTSPHQPTSAAHSHNLCLFSHLPCPTSICTHPILITYFTVQQTAATVVPRVRSHLPCCASSLLTTLPPSLKYYYYRLFLSSLLFYHA